MKRIILLLIMCLVLVGCEVVETTELNRTPIGKVLDANIVPTSFNESQKTIIKTEGAVVIVYGIKSVIKGDGAYLKDMSNGLQYLCLDSAEYCWRIGR